MRDSFVLLQVATTLLDICCLYLQLEKGELDMLVLGQFQAQTKAVNAQRLKFISKAGEFVVNSSCFYTHSVWRSTTICCCTSARIGILQESMSTPTKYHIIKWNLMMYKLFIEKVLYAEVHAMSLPVIYPAWNFHLVIILPAMTFGDGIGGGGCIQSVQTAWPSLGSALEMPRLALGGPLLSSYTKMCWETVLSPCTAPISSGEAPVWASSCRLSVMTIASLLMGGCGLSHKWAEDGLRALLWSLGAENPTELGISESHIKSC